MLLDPIVLATKGQSSHYIKLNYANKLKNFVFLLIENSDLFYSSKHCWLLSSDSGPDV